MKPKTKVQKRKKKDSSNNRFNLEKIIKILKTVFWLVLVYKGHVDIINLKTNALFSIVLNWSC